MELSLVKVTKVTKVMGGIRVTKVHRGSKGIRVTTERTATGVFKATRVSRVFRALQTGIKDKGIKVTKVPRVIKVLYG
jgi:hypothetical protein